MIQTLHHLSFHVKTASIPSRKANFSCLWMTGVTSLAFLVQGRLEKELVNSCKRTWRLTE